MSEYKLESGSEVKVSWDAVERIAPEAMVAWDESGRDINKIGVIDRTSVPYVQEATGAWFVWTDESWQPWSRQFARNIVNELGRGWAQTSEEAGTGGAFSTIPSRGRLDWSVWVQQGWSGLRYATYPDDRGNWTQESEFTPENIGRIMADLERKFGSR